MSHIILLEMTLIWCVPSSIALDAQCLLRITYYTHPSAQPYQHLLLQNWPCRSGCGACGSLEPLTLKAWEHLQTPHEAVRTILALYSPKKLPRLAAFFFTYHSFGQKTVASYCIGKTASESAMGSTVVHKLPPAPSRNPLIR